MGLIVFLLCSLFSATHLLAQDQEGFENRRRVRAVRLSEGESISLDGRLDEDIWQRAEAAADFVQVEPSNGDLATEPTEVRIAYDSESLYLGILCFDSEPEKVLGNQLQRDGFLSADDRFMWTIDTYLDGRTGYFFEINPLGSMGDSLVGSGGGGFGGGGQRAWDGIWMARVVKSELGWTAEIEIPFRTLNFDPESPAWGINFQRSVRRKNEESRWNGWARNQHLRDMSSAGLVIGIEQISQGAGLDIQPYLVTKHFNGTGTGEPGRTRWTPGWILFYSLTPKLRASFTINTDFAETEVDDRQVNLTRFPLFFPEKRDFFLDGLGFFSFSQEPGRAVVPFFSRTIGLDDDGNPQPILFGAKLAGQIGSQDLGVLQVRTADSGDFMGENFTVLRGRNRFWSQSYLGMIYTRRAGDETSGPDRHTVGTDFSLSTSQFRGADNLEFSGFYLWTSNPEDTGESESYGVRLEYPNDLWNARLSYREVQENYDPALGFSRRENIRRLNPVLAFSPRPKDHPWIRRFSFQIFLDRTTDTENQLLSRTLDLKVFHMNTHAGDQVQVHVLSEVEHLDEDFEIHDGIILPLGEEYDFNRYRLAARTAGRRPFSIRSELEWGDFFSGQRREFSADVTLRPRPGLRLELGGEWNRVELAEGSFSTSLLEAEVSSQFGPWISLSNDLQYDSVSRELGWQFRFRWILRPGNDLFLVYSQNWLNDPFSGLETLRLNAAAKFIYTHRF